MCERGKGQQVAQVDDDDAIAVSVIGGQIEFSVGITKKHVNETLIF